MRFPLRPLLIPTSPPTPLGVEATYLLPPSKGKRSLLAYFSPLLMRFSGSSRSQRFPPPPPPTLAIPRHPLGDEATYRRPASEGKRFLLESRCPFLTLFFSPSPPFSPRGDVGRRQSPHRRSSRAPLAPSPPPPFSSPTSTCRVRSRSRDHVRCSTFWGRLLLTSVSALAIAIVAGVEGPSSVLVLARLDAFQPLGEG